MCQNHYHFHDSDIDTSNDQNNHSKNDGLREKTPRIYDSSNNNDMQRLGVGQPAGALVVDDLGKNLSFRKVRHILP